MNLRNISLALIAISSTPSLSIAGAGFGEVDLPGQTIERRLRAGDGGGPIVYVVRENAEVMFSGISSGATRLLIVGPGGQTAGKLDLKAGKKKSQALNLKKGEYLLILRALSTRADVRIELKPLDKPAAPSTARIPSVNVEVSAARGSAMRASQGPIVNPMDKSGDEEAAAGKLSKNQGAVKTGSFGK